MEVRPQGQGKLEGEQLEAGAAPSGSELPGSRLPGLSESAARSAPVTISIRQSPPPPGRPGREGRGAARRGAEHSLQIGRKQGLGTARGRAGEQ